MIAPHYRLMEILPMSKEFYRERWFVLAFVNPIGALSAEPDSVVWVPTLVRC
jgi:hypothetical protein